MMGVGQPFLRRVECFPSHKLWLVFVVHKRKFLSKSSNCYCKEEQALSYKMHYVFSDESKV